MLHNKQTHKMRFLRFAEVLDKTYAFIIISPLLQIEKPEPEPLRLWFGLLGTCRSGQVNEVPFAKSSVSKHIPRLFGYDERWMSNLQKGHRALSF